VLRRNHRSIRLKGYDYLTRGEMFCMPPAEHAIVERVDRLHMQAPLQEAFR